jgi:hypothetical protein
VVGPKDDSAAGGELDLALSVKALPRDFGRFWELGQHLIKQGWIEKIVKDNVGERFCACVQGARGFCDLSHSG